MLRIIIAATVIMFYTAYRLTRVKNIPDLPRIGKPGFKGFISTAFRFTFDAESCIDEGWTQFSGRPFMIPTLVSPILFPNSFCSRAHRPAR